MSDEGSVGANLKPSSLHCRTVELDPASPRFFDAREDPASPPPEAAIAELLLQAEQLWLKGKRDGSLALYDRAIGVAAAAGDTDKEMEIELGRGFALLQLDEKDGRRATANARLERVAKHADAAGQTTQANFVRSVIASNGVMELDSTAGSASTGCSSAIQECGDEARARLAELVVTAPAGSEELVKYDQSDAGESESWSATAESELIVAVAELGISDLVSLSGRLETKLPPDHPNRPGDGVGVDSIRTAWKRLVPRLRKELESDEERACGHSCGSCPTRSTCELHAAVDIEDL